MDTRNQLEYPDYDSPLKYLLLKYGTLHEQILVLKGDLPSQRCYRLAHRHGERRCHPSSDAQTRTHAVQLQQNQPVYPLFENAPRIDWVPTSHKNAMLAEFPLCCANL